MNTHLVARSLGWFSIGLGLAELIAPRTIKSATGLRNDDQLLRLFGIREIASGLGILSQTQRSGWMWSRVAGDAIDLGVLGAAFATSRRSRRRKLGIAMATVAGVTVLDLINSIQLRREELNRNGHHGNGQGGHGTHTTWTGKLPLTNTITINRPLEEVYAFWRSFENLPRFLNHLKAVTDLGGGRSHWVAKGPAGSDVEWDAEIIEEKTNELISWRSLPGAMVDNAGTVRFEPATGGRGTVVRVKLQYQPPGGAVGATIAKLFGESPEKQIPIDLGRVKQLLETGEIARTEGQPAGRSRSTSKKFDDFVRI
jgi:uncharacterized membrane protein